VVFVGSDVIHLRNAFPTSVEQSAEIEIGTDTVKPGVVTAVVALRVVSSVVAWGVAAPVEGVIPL
jgi:hypothetical protein